MRTAVLRIGKWSRGGGRCLAYEGRYLDFGIRIYVFFSIGIPWVCSALLCSASPRIATSCSRDPPTMETDTTDAFLIRDVRIFTGDTTIPNGFIHISHGKILAVGPAPDTPQLPIPTYSKPGHTLLPGLIDCHIHADMANPSALPQALRFGVTTVCEMHNELQNVRTLRKQALEPDTAAYKTAGQAATIENGWPIPVITAHDKSEETAAEIAKWPKLSNRKNVVEYLEWMGREMQPDYIKLMHESGTAMGWPLTKPSPELQRIIVEEARTRGYQTVAHATSLQDTLEVLEAGVDGLTHTMCDQPPTQELVDAYKRSGAWVNPTLATMASLTGEGKELQRRFAHDPRVEHLLDGAAVDNLCNCMGFCAQHGKVEYAYESVRMLREAGVDVLWYDDLFLEIFCFADME